MKFSRELILTELEYVENNYEFSENCPEDLQQHLLDKMLVDLYEGHLMVTPEGELLLGGTKEDLREMYDEFEEEREQSDDGFFHDFHYQESEAYEGDDEYEHD